MLETELRDSLRTAVATEPALTLDIDEVVVRARKETARSRALVATGAATFVLVGGIVVGPTVARATGGMQPAGFPGPAPAITSSAPIVPKYSSAQLAERSTALAAALPTRVAAVVPGVSDLQTHPGSTPGLRDFVGIARFTTFTLDGARYGIHFTVITNGVEDLSEKGACVVVRPECLPGGLVGDASMRHVRSVDVVRPDSSVVTVAWLAADTGGPPAEALDGYLTQLANDPTLRF
ncbi:hypothetical protein [Actinokineospora xionganensis]|uniref:Uncharacterized protein n=1 Tax=Actinokineospora xionganensis TaxID=2684470 RepID=A0ABR7L214_9PSEU|nr:hypothetical protein [Actinokineospora xionganensis]MBC6446728.1 hypothetical protein [Actinokineospora xionganensis]